MTDLLTRRRTRLKITRALVEDVRRETPGKSQAELADMFGCSVSTVRNIHGRHDIKPGHPCRMKGKSRVGVPAWLPHAVHSVFREWVRRYGQFEATARARRARREAEKWLGIEHRPTEQRAAQ